MSLNYKEVLRPVMCLLTLHVNIRCALTLDQIIRNDATQHSVAKAGQWFIELRHNNAAHLNSSA